MKDERYYHAYLSHHHVSRRGLLRGIFGAAEKAGTITHDKRQESRPPFCATESLFLAACTGCGECVKACPFGLIQIKQHKAHLEIDYASCNFCGECAKACSTNALNLHFPADTELRPIFNQQCLSYGGQSCTTCVEACPKQAIYIDHEIQVSKDCNGCGECKIACFMQAITLQLS
ncbi:ferredoxin-type protein NapF [Conservatibacter flavescens]|uniref:Ferredoxin-type protein NapF n=1 Tax=Conservatibacter flavescens TaxID=28161 RepID=A0A2M8RZU5_9PAST|nr:ferredoxin-type protein NapF [Conservatibacter flavescens]PJG84388.1 ferredoxin-type protein NapF [Conservatibacter flavescens]